MAIRVFVRRRWGGIALFTMWCGLHQVYQSVLRLSTTAVAGEPCRPVEHWRRLCMNASGMYGCARQRLPGGCAVMSLRLAAFLSVLIAATPIAASAQTTVAG